MPLHGCILRSACRRTLAYAAQKSPVVASERSLLDDRGRQAVHASNGEAAEAEIGKGPLLSRQIAHFLHPGHQHDPLACSVLTVYPAHGGHGAVYARLAVRRDSVPAAADDAQPTYIGLAEPTSGTRRRRRTLAPSGRPGELRLCCVRGSSSDVE